MSGGQWNYPEHLGVGLKPHAVQEKYDIRRAVEAARRLRMVPLMQQEAENPRILQAITAVAGVYARNQL